MKQLRVIAGRPVIEDRRRSEILENDFFFGLAVSLGLICAGTAALILVWGFVTLLFSLS